MKQCFVSPSQPGRLLLVDDDPILRRGLAQMIARDGDLAVCGEASDTGQAVDLFARLAPDLALIDISRHSALSLQLVRDLRRLQPGFPALLLARATDHGQIERALRSGARGVISKWSSSREVCGAIRAVLAGSVYAPGHIDIGPDWPPSVKPADILSGREMEVLGRLGRGHDRWEIASALALDAKTVSAYLCNIRRKLDLPSMLALHLRAHALYGPGQEPDPRPSGST